MVSDKTILKEIDYIKQYRDDETKEAVLKLESAMIEINTLKNRLNKSINGTASFGTLEGIPSIIGMLATANDMISKAKACDRMILELDSLVAKHDE